MPSSRSSSRSCQISEGTGVPYVEIALLSAVPAASKRVIGSVEAASPLQMEASPVVRISVPGAMEGYAGDTG